MKPCYEGFKEIRVDVNEIWRKMLCFRVSIGLATPYFDHLIKWNPVMKVWKKFRVDVNEIWRKMLCFRVSIGLLPLILIISWNETLLWRFERDWSWCQWDMKENVRFWSKYRVFTPYLDCLMKWNPVMKVWRKSGLMLMRYEGKYKISE